jgi:hypothetical protein
VGGRQWQWVDEEGQEDDDTEHGEWALRRKEPLAVRTMLEHLPTVLHGWVLDSTARAITDLHDLAGEKPAFKVALDKLRGELGDVEPANEHDRGEGRGAEDGDRHDPARTRQKLVRARSEAPANFA